MFYGSMFFVLVVEEVKFEVVVFLSGWNFYLSYFLIYMCEYWMVNNFYWCMFLVDVIYINLGLFVFVYFFGFFMVVYFGILVGLWGDGCNVFLFNEDIGVVVVGVFVDFCCYIG